MVDKEIKKWIDGNLVAISNNLEELKELKITHEISEESKTFLDDNYISVEIMKSWMKRNYLNDSINNEYPIPIIFNKLFIRYNILNGHPIIQAMLNENGDITEQIYLDSIPYTCENNNFFILKGGYLVNISAIKFTNVKPQYDKKLPSYDEVYMLFNYKDKNELIGSLYTKEDLKKIGLIKE